MTLARRATEAQEPLPFAAPLGDDPRVVGRVVDLMARGVRSQRAVQETLGLDGGAVDRALASAAFLGLLEGDGEPSVTIVGLEYAYGGAQRTKIWGRAVLAQPFVAKILRGPPPSLPAVGEIAEAVRSVAPTLDELAARQRANAIRGLCAPVLGKRAPKSETAQLALPLPAKGPDVDVPQIAHGPGRECDPDLLRHVAGVLLDHGELSLGGLRAILDRAGVPEAPIGGYIDLLLVRGDAVRLEERLVISRQGARRRGLVDTATSMVLSDPGYRAWLADGPAAAAGDRPAQIRRERHRLRYRSWDRRLFQREVEPDQVERELRRVLLDRGVGSYPLATGPGVAPSPVRAGFLDVWERDDLAVALPPALGDLRGGLAAANHAIKVARQGADSVHLPVCVERPAAVHGALCHPGEALPRAIPDVRTLRQRLVLHAPYASMVAALLLIHRRQPDRVAVRSRRGGFAVRCGDAPVELLDLLDAFGVSRGWIVSRRTRGGLGAAALIAVLDTVGITTPVADLCVLSERFFGMLRSEPDEGVLHERLGPLGEAIAAFIEAGAPEIA